VECEKACAALNLELACERQSAYSLKKKLEKSIQDHCGKDELVANVHSRLAASEKAAERAAIAARQQVRAKDRALQELFDMVGKKERALREIQASAAWSLAQGLRGLRAALAPAGSRRWRVWRWSRRLIGGGHGT
jgi:hypothetical protein